MDSNGNIRRDQQLFKEFPGGTSFVLQKITVHLPPFPMVPNYYDGTGDLIISEVLFSEYEKEDQYWRLSFDHENYQELKQEEDRLKRLNTGYIDEALEEIRLREWKRRLNGVWIMVNGTPTYITGLYYFYLSYWPMDTGQYAEYRNPDLEKSYFWQTCIENPKCLGMLEITVRRAGKTQFAACAMYEYLSRQKGKKGGIQSKTDSDAFENVYDNAMISPMKKMPDFFLPKYDEEKGLTSKSGLSFNITRKKGVDHNEATKSELNSHIFIGNAKPKAFDGKKLHRVCHDECSKLENHNVYARHLVLRKCCLDTSTGNYIGKMLATTTVAEIEAGGLQFEVYWNNSDQTKIDEVTGETPSGLFRFATYAYRTMYFDKYGNPDEVRARKDLTAKLQSLIGNPAAYNKERRESPMSEADIFSTDAQSCPFNVAVIDGARLYMSMLESNHRERPGMYSLEWSEQDKTVIASPNPAGGKWEFSWFPPKADQNKILDTGTGTGRFKPLNNDKFAIGVDPVSSGVEAEHGSSDAAIAVYRKHDIHNEAELYSNNFVANYVHDPDNPEDFYEELIMACVFFGCEVLIEKNKFDVYNYMKRRGYIDFVMKRPENSVSITHKGELTEGIYAGTDTIDLYVNRLKTYWAQHGHRCRQERILEDARRFTVKSRGQRDLTVACGWAILAAETPYKPKTVNIPIGDIFAFRNQQNRH